VVDGDGEAEGLGLGVPSGEGVAEGVKEAVALAVVLAVALATGVGVATGDGVEATTFADTATVSGCACEVSSVQISTVPCNVPSDADFASWMGRFRVSPAATAVAPGDATLRAAFDPAAIAT
jgi:hypothetical protein